MFGPGAGLGGLPRGGMRDFGRGGGHGPGGTQPYAVLLAVRLVYQISQLRHKPPLTLALMAGMCALHLKPALFEGLIGGAGMFDWIWLTRDHVRSVCMYPAAMLESYERTGDPQLRRLLISPFVHGDDVHLFSNMGSFLLKGVALELTMGTQAFAGLLAFALLASQLLMVLSSWALLVVFEIPSQMQACSVGFSGVLFALTYVLSRRSPGMTMIAGFPVNLRYAVWLELVLISVLVSNASFLGHLCGILAGILYVEVPAVLRLVNLLTGATLFRGRQVPSYTYTSGTASSARPPASGRQYGQAQQQQQPESSPPSSFDMTSDPDAAEEAAVQEALRRSILDSTGNGGGGSSSNGSGFENHGAARDIGNSGMSATWNGRDIGNSGMSATWNGEPSPDAAAAAAEILGPAPTAPPSEELEEDVVVVERSGGDMGRDELRRRRLQRLGGGT